MGEHRVWGAGAGGSSPLILTNCVHSSAGERSVHTGDVGSSILSARTSSGGTVPPVGHGPTRRTGRPRSYRCAPSSSGERRFDIAKAAGSIPAARTSYRSGGYGCNGLDGMPTWTRGQRPASPPRGTTQISTGRSKIQAQPGKERPAICPHEKCQ